MPDGTAPSEVTVRVLGPTAVVPAIALTGMQRVLLARLALGGRVPTDALVATAWPDRPPPTARAALQNQVSRLRAAIGTAAIETIGDHYVLRAATDVGRSRELARAAETRLAEGDPEAALALAQEAVALTDGLPFADLASSPEVDQARREVAAWIRTAEDVVVTAATEVGRTGLAVAAATRLYEAEPLDEGRAALLARALAAAGRRGDALGVIQRTRDTLRRELGLDLGAALVELRRTVLEPAVDSAGPELPLVGRSAPLAAVAAAVASGRSVVVHAQPGAGLSRFLQAVHESQRRGEGTSALVHPRPEAWHPAAELRDLLEVLGVTPDGASGVVHGFLSALATVRGPVTLVVDDADRLGPSTQSVLVRASELPGVVVVQGRRDGMTLPDQSVVDLPGLRPEDVDALVQLRCGPGTHPEARAQLARDTAGSPQLLTALLGDAQVRAWLREPGADPAPLPDSLVPWADARLRELGAAGRVALEVLAIAGTSIPTDRLTSLLPPVGVDELVRAGLVHVRGTDVELRHDLLRRGVVASTAPGRRADLHHAIAVRADGLPAAIVANHRRESAALDPEAAVDVHRRAALDAHRHGAHADAAQWLREAEQLVLDHRGDLPTAERELVSTRIQLGEALRLAGDSSHVQVLLDAATEADRLGSIDLYEDAALALLQLGATTASGAPHPAVADVVRHVQERSVDPERRAVVEAAGSLASSMTGDAARSHDLFTRAEATAVTSAARRGVLPFTYLALGHPRELARREAHADELERLARDADDPIALFEALHLQFSNALIRPDHRRRSAAMTEMTAMMDRVGDVGRRWSVTYQAATVAHLDGDDAEAERLADVGLAIFGPVSPSRAFATQTSQLLAVRMTDDRISTLRPQAEGIVAQQPEVGAWHAFLALTLVAVAPQAAARHATTALHHADEDFTWLAAHVVGGRAAAAVGDPLTRRAYRDRLEPFIDLGCWQGSCSLGPVATTVALLHRAEGDEAAAVAAAERARRCALALGSRTHAAELNRLGF